MMELVPRRIQLSQMVPAERAIFDAAQVVEAMPPDERLTQAMNLLHRARALVGDYVDGVASEPTHTGEAEALVETIDGLFADAHASFRSYSERRAIFLANLRAVICQ